MNSTQCQSSDVHNVGLKLRSHKVARRSSKWMTTITTQSHWLGFATAHWTHGTEWSCSLRMIWEKISSAASGWKAGYENAAFSNRVDTVSNRRRTTSCPAWKTRLRSNHIISERQTSDMVNVTSRTRIRAGAERRQRSGSEEEGGRPCRVWLYDFPQEARGGQLPH